MKNMSKILPLPLMIASFLMANPIAAFGETEASKETEASVEIEASGKSNKQELETKIQEYIMYISGNEGKGLYKIKGPETWLELIIEKTYCLGLGKKKMKFSLYSNPVKGIYRQNGEEFSVPETVDDILTAVRKKKESPYYGPSEEIISVFVNKGIQQIILRDVGVHNPDRIVEVFAIDKEELGAGIKGIGFYLSEEEGVLLEQYFLIYHKTQKEPFYFSAGKLEKLANGRGK